MDRRRVGYLLAFLSAVAGAVRYNFAVFAEPYGFAYMPFLAYALAVGLVCCTVHVAVRDGAKGFVPLRGRWAHALLYGLLMGWSTMSHFIGLHYLNETVMSSLAQTSLLFTIALAVWLLGERFTVQEWIATAVIFLGVFVFRPWQGGNLKGFLILLSGAATGACATVGAKRWVAGTPPRVLMWWRNAIALVLAGAYAIAFSPPPQITLATALACVATGIVGPYLHGLFFLQALERIDASKASLMNRVQPAVVFLLSWALLDRMPGVDERASAALLVVGTIWLAAARRPSK